MAKFVVAGRANCPYYARVELLADYLQKNVPDFKVHKIVQAPEDWQKWLQAVCKANNWEHHNSPIIWRELVDRGGKGLLLGGFNDFMEYAQEYYGFTYDMMTTLMIKIARENLKAFENEQEEEMFYKNLIKPMPIWISGRPSLSKKRAAYGLLQKVTVQDTLRKAFMDAEVIIVLDDFTPEEDQPIEDCYKEMAGFYQELAVRIDTFAKSNARVIVAGDHILNLKTYLLLNNVYSIDRCNFIAVSTQLEVEVKALLAKKLSVRTEDVKDVILWGNLSRSIYIDLHRARVSRYESAIWGPPDFSRSVQEVLQNRNWVEEEFLEEVYSHRPKIQAALGQKLGFSLAAAIDNVLHWWYFDSPPGEIVSLGVISQGEFDIPPGLVFSMPVRFCGGKWIIQTQIEISEETKDKLKHIAQELKLALVPEDVAKICGYEKIPAIVPYTPQNEDIIFTDCLHPSVQGRQANREGEKRSVTNFRRKC